MKRNKVLAIVAILIAVIATVVILVVVFFGKTNHKVEPVAIKLALPKDKPTLMKLGTSRVFTVLFFSGHDNRTLDNYKGVTEKAVYWDIHPKGIISIDPYGRVETLALGKVKVKVTSIANIAVFD